MGWGSQPCEGMNNRIRDLVNAHPHANFLLNRLELLIDTSSKGGERDVMIFSPVVSDGTSGPHNASNQGRPGRYQQPSSTLLPLQRDEERPG